MSKAQALAVMHRPADHTMQELGEAFLLFYDNNPAEAFAAAIQHLHMHAQWLRDADARYDRLTRKPE